MGFGVCSPDGSIQSHTGAIARMQRCIVDEHGRSLPGHRSKGLAWSTPQDVLQAADLIEPPVGATRSAR